MIKRVLEFFANRGFITVLPIKKSFFKPLFFEESVKMDEEAIRLNYSHLSPFPKSAIIYKNEGKNLYLWFYQDENIQRSKIVIPEAYLIYKRFKDKNAVIVIEESVYKIVVVKDFQILSQTVKDKVDEKYLELLKKEYGVEKEIFLNKRDYEEILGDSFYSLSFADILRFGHFEIDKNFWVSLLERISLPVLAIVFFMITIEYGEYFYIKNEIASKTKEYRELKRKNDQIRSEIEDLEREAEKYINFSKHNKDPFYKTELLSFAVDVAKKNDSRMVYAQFAGDKTVIVVRGVKPNKVLNDLLSANYFKELRIEVSHKERDGNETTRMEGILNVK